MTEFRIAVIGERKFNDYKAMESILSSFIRIHKEKDICIVSGEAIGADTLAKRYASESGLDFQCFHADRNKHGLVAGFIRDKEIIKNCDSVIAFYNGKSSGTKNALDEAERSGIPSYIVSF